jgi:hypothetical protein
VGGGRLAVAPAARGLRGIGAALVRAACTRAEAEGTLRFDATVQARSTPLFARLGWLPVRETTVAGVPHVLMRWPIGRIGAQVAAAKSALGPLLLAFRRPADRSPGGDTRSGGGAAPAALGGAGFVGDDGAPVPGTDVVAACDAIVPSMVERDPAWAGWCSVLVNANDLAAMGASPLGLLDAVGAADAGHAARILGGLGQAAEAYGVPCSAGTPNSACRLRCR